MRTIFSVDAVALDLDGTLLDTLPDLAEAAERMLAELGCAPAGTDRVRDFVGNGIPRLVKRLLSGAREGEPPPEQFARALASFQRHYRDTFLRSPAAFPGVEEGLVRMREQGLRLACVTNKSGDFTLPLLEVTGLAAMLDYVVSGDSLPAKKPDPLPLQHIAQRFGVPPARLLMVGDSDNDTQAARAAGCPVVCVPYGYSGGLRVRDLDCDAIVSDLIEACALIARA
jgi:phosphoglycolate phosphatase